MKEFTTAVESVVAEDERAEKIAALIESGKSQRDAEAEVDGETYVEFKVDERVLRAYRPHEGQLLFMMAATGRGQSNDGRTAAIINVMSESLRGDDRDYFENRLLTSDRKQRLPLENIVGIFEYLIEEWFARPTQSQSGSALSPPSAGQN